MGTPRGARLVLGLACLGCSAPGPARPPEPPAVAAPPAEPPAPPPAPPEAPVDADAPAPPRLATDDPEFMRRVVTEVARGVEALLRRAQADGRWETEHDRASHGDFPHGGTALAIHALLKTGVNRFDPRIEAGIAWLRERWEHFVEAGKPIGQPDSWKTYEAGLALQMLEAVGRWRPPAMGPRHGAADGDLPKADHAWVVQLRDFLLEQQAVARQVVQEAPGRGLADRREAWSYPSGGWVLTDHSNTLYAVLGLKSAARLGHPSPAALWIRTLEGFLFTQAEDGDPVLRIHADPRRRGVGLAAHAVRDRARGWGYAGGFKPYEGTGQLAETGSMTCAGIACVAIAWSEIEVLADAGDEDAKAARTSLSEMKNTSLHDGLAWLAHHWRVTENPNYRTWHYYYLAGLERAGVLANRDHVGTHDWYREGVDLLLQAQRPDGLWDDGNGDGVVASTCFALQFLTRATIPLVRITKD